MKVYEGYQSRISRIQREISNYGVPTHNDWLHTMHNTQPLIMWYQISRSWFDCQSKLDGFTVDLSKPKWKFNRKTEQREIKEFEKDLDHQNS